MDSFPLRLRPVFFIVVMIAALCGPAGTRAAEIVYTLELRAAEVSIRHLASGDLAHIDDERYASTSDVGLPQVPVRIVSLLLPPGATVDGFTCDASAPAVLATSIDPYLVPEAVSTDGSRGEGPAATTWSGGSYPEASAVYLGTGYLHGHAIASFALYPVRIAGGAVTVSEHMTLRVRTGNGGPEMHVVSRLRYNEQRDADVRARIGALVENPEAMSAYTIGSVRVADRRGGFKPTSFPSLEGSPVDYVIVTNDSLADEFQVLADWKTAKGIPTVIRTTEWIAANYPNGVDLAETIRTFVLDAYQYWGIKYLLLGGDTDQVPARLGATTFFGAKAIPVDMYFGCLDGDWNADHDALFGEPGATDQTDLYQEVYVGRLPATSSVVAATLVGKVISYETPLDASYTGKVLLLGEVLFPIDWTSGQAVTQDGAGIAEFLKLLAFTDPSLTLTRMYENYEPYPGALPETAVSAIDSIESGYDHVNHIGHGFRFNMSVGAGNIVNADADAMVNPNRFTNLYLLNCTGVAFTYFCLGEHFLVNPNGGAVSVVGANESAYPLLSQPYMNDYYDLLFNQGVTNIGETFVRSREPRTPVAQTGDNGELWTHYIYCMLADPEMPLWTRPVQPLVVNYTGALGLGTTPITVTVSDAGGPVAGARVCLSKDDDDYEVGLTDGAGSVTLTMTAESAGNVSVVASAPNRATHVGAIPVSPGAGAYVSFAGCEVGDDSTATTSGNGDGVIGAGEVLELTASVRNTGLSAAQNVTLALRTSYVGFVVEDSLAAVGIVPAGGTVAATDPFRIRIDPSLPDELPVLFTLEVRDNGVPLWTDRFTRLVHTPRLEFVVLRVDDSASGNGDGVVDAGEDFRLYYDVKNFGTGAAHGLTARLTDLGGAFVFTDSVDTYPELPSIGEAENTNGFLLRENSVAVPHTLKLEVADAYGQVWTKLFELRAPVPPLTLKFDPSLGADRLKISWDASASADAVGYRVLSSPFPGGPYSVMTPDPVHHTTFLSGGLQPTTRYYMRVTTIDASGNESAPSPEFSGSTNPKQAEGWPIAMAVETVCSPVVGDIDGDNDFEIIQGNNKLYAWHHNGVEVRDADLNAQTWGLFSTLGSNYVAHVGLADMDAVPGMEILAASRDTKQVIVFSYTGNPIAGWPQTVLNPIRAAVVAGDINNDGQKEVIALDEKGVLYVWNPDGSEWRNGDNNPATNGVFRTFGGCVYQYTCPAIADIDGDNVNEIVVGTQGDSLYVLNADGSVVPGWPKGFSTDISGSPAVGDIDNDGDLEIVVCEWGGLVWALHHDGTILWNTWFQNQLAFGPSPALGDLDGDGRLEVVLPSKNRNLYAIRWNGSSLPGWPVAYATQLYTESSPVIADIDNDGSLDVLLGDENKYLNAWDASGQLMPGFPLALSDAVRATPLIADVDKDGDTDLVAAGWDKSVYVWDFPSMFNPLKAPWARYHANLFNDGNVATPLPTPVGGASFRYAALGGGMELVWTVPLSASGGLFNVSRAELKDGEPGPYRRVASAVGLSMDGEVRVVDRGVEMGSRYVYRLEGEGGVVNETLAVLVPVTIAKLGQNYPNPFNPVTTIEYWVPGGSRNRVSLVIYDVRGARVRTLVDREKAAGRYAAQWDGRNDAGAPVSSGVYFYRMVAGGFENTRRMVLLK
ncbi:MAG: C25 family cysteine peptidase [Candidatus Krumholzibacteria bacterium]|nr:C25 family cysteine peptidase [Candidatus Krumholzibacteria bacterium]MDH4335978.1 C25 family cysteine peptidase [Candidatus Krumholzibacteria bacterium]MDH5268446.1 C25 family cysteine peptidase [Candidatus Krumholzibacteria bacterium]